VSTAVLQGRRHAAPARGFDPRILRRLVRSNQVRVVAWPAGGILALWMCHWAFAP